MEGSGDESAGQAWNGMGAEQGDGMCSSERGKEGGRRLACLTQRQRSGRISASSTWEQKSKVWATVEEINAGLATRKSSADADGTRVAEEEGTKRIKWWWSRWMHVTQATFF